MAKNKIQNYVFLPGVAKSSNAYPNAYSLISNNKEFIKAEVVAYINAQVATDNASNLYPNAVTLLTNNKQFIIDEIIAWVAYKVTNNIAPFVGYTYDQAACRRDTGYLIDAIIYDVRYGGNEKTIDIAKSFWQGGVAQLISPVQETAAFDQIFTIITDFILPKTAYSSQQSPVTSTQNISGSAAEAGVATNINNNLKPIISNVIAGGLSTLPAVTYSTRNYAGYIFDSSKCNRDVGYVIDAYLNDLRYGGNTETRYISSRFWKGTTPQLSGDRRPEITAQTWIRDLINNTILPQASYPTPYQTAVPRFVNGSITAEGGSTARITTLADSFIAVLTNGLSSLPTLVNGVTTIRLQGKYDLDRLLLITNTTNNTILYNFADPTHVAAVDLSSGYVSNDYWQDDDFPTFRNITDWITTITFDIDASTSSSSDKIQILVEEKEMKVRPYDFGTDAIERHRMAMPESMLDADFEYGLQPTKWQAIGLQRGYPSVYEVPGTETPVSNVTTDASSGTGGVGQSLITVTTVGPHGFSVGTPFTIKSLANSISGFSRAEGTFIVNTVPSNTTFTYYSQSKVGTSNGQVLATTYTQLRKAEFYTGASLGTPTFSVVSNGSNVTLTSKFSVPSGVDQIAYTAASVPSVGSTLSGTGIGSGAQVTGTVGTGGAAITATLETATTVGDTSITLNSTSGILEGLAIDNGSGEALFVTSIAGNTVSLTGQLTSSRRGSTKTYTNVSGTNLNPTGIGAQFNLERVNGNYANVSVGVAGSGYVIGDRITIPGTTLEGTTPLNNLTITVTGVDGLGGITALNFSGTSITGNASYTAIQQTSTSGVGTDASFNIARTSGSYTVGLSVAGSNYVNGDTIVISGTILGGTSPTNDLTITVVTVGGSGGIIDFTFSGTAYYNAVFSGVTGTNVLPIGAGASFDIVRTAGGYTVTVNQGGSNYFLGEKIKVLGTSLDGATPTNDAIISITSVSGNSVTGASISGTGILGETVEFWSSVSFSELTTATVPDSTSITATGIATLQVSFSNAHGLVPGQSIIAAITSVGSNHNLAQGPFFIESIPSATTFRYSARAVGNISTAESLTGIVYTRSDAYFVHRPFDGGVQLGAGGPQHGAQAIRMSKKYVRYQSGKGINYCTGALFAPSFNVQSVSATGTNIGSFITITTDDVDHGCQVGAVIKLSGIETKGYNNQYTVSDIINERQLKVQAVSVLASTTAVLTANSQISLIRWHGATVRAGTFDEQNGIFMQYDGQEFAIGKRSSTFQIAGTVNIARDTNLVTGTNTRFRDQIKAGDKIVIRGMTHVVTNVLSQTSMTVNPDYRGASNCVNAKICLIQDLIIPQREFNLDKLDGTGPSGYNLDVSKMQMIGMQWSWYAVGFIDFMMRGSDGNFVFFHRIRNSNVNTEAYMRTGNQPVRYEVINEGARGKLLESITANQTTIPLVDASNFPNESATVMIDNELISYTAKVGNTLTGCTRAAPMTNFVGGSQRTFTGGSAATHELNTGVILVSNTVSPIISHWGSAILTDGNFDEDRGYIFSYAATNVSVSTTKQTAFLIRLAPSVSNAIIGDLGDRELINRAQLLLKGIEITSDNGTGGIVVEGVLNPQNYPVDPSAIAWGGLASAATGGQPSFAQIAPGGSVSWSSGATQTTSPVTTLAFPTGTVTGRQAMFGNSNNTTFTGYNYFPILNSDYLTYINNGLAAGDSISGTGIPAGSTISGFGNNTYRVSGVDYRYVFISQNFTATTAGNQTFTVTRTYKTSNTSTIFFPQAAWESSGAKSGTEISDTLFPAGAYVSSASRITFFGTTYYRVTTSQTSSATAINPGTTAITFRFGQPPYGLPGETVFSFVAAPGGTVSLDLSELKELTNTTLGGRGCYPNGPDVLAINVYKAAGSATPANIVLRWGEAQA